MLTVLGQQANSHIVPDQTTKWKSDDSYHQTLGKKTRKISKTQKLYPFDSTSTVHATIPQLLFTAPVRSGWSHVCGDYTQTYYRKQHAIDAAFLSQIRVIVGLIVVSTILP